MASTPANPSDGPVMIVRPAGLFAGSVGGLGVAVLLQQYGVAPATTASLVGWTIGAALFVGVVIPTLVAAAAERGRREREAEPRKPEGST